MNLSGLGDNLRSDAVVDPFTPLFPDTRDKFGCEMILLAD